MEILAWNLNHRTLEKIIPPEAIHFFKAKDADIISLNEFVDGSSRDTFKQQLSDLGYFHQLISPKRGKQNRVFVASKKAIRLGDLNPPQQDDASVTNFLHVVEEESGIEFVGFRAPAYKMYSERQTYWRELTTIMSNAGRRRIVFAGDINYDPFQGLAASVTDIKFELSQSYYIPNPQGEWSYISLDEKARTRIDHAIVTAGLKTTEVRYLVNFQGILLAGGHNSNAVSDHAVLSFSVSE